MKTILTNYTIQSDFDLDICLISDIHQRYNGEAISIIKDLHPDIIVVAGDTFERYIEEDDSLYRKPVDHILLLLMRGLNHLTGLSSYHPPTSNSYSMLEEICDIAPIYLGLGNHEFFLTDKDKEFFKAHHITFVHNNHSTYKDITIGCIPTNVDTKYLESFKKIDTPKLLICHHPDYYDKYDLKDIPLILSGHTHGGQIRFFKHSLYASGMGLFPKYSKGIYHNNLIVSAGLSNTLSIPRINNPCEVVYIKVRQSL